MKKRLNHGTWAIILLVLALTVSGCGSSNSETTAANEASSAASGGDFKVALLTPGPVNDNGWNAVAYQGLQQIGEELKAETKYSEKVTQSDMNEFIRGYADDGFNVIIGHGFEFADAMMAVANDYPNTWFLVTSASVSQEPNVASISINNRQQGYLMGTVAALMSTTGTVAAIGGMDIPPISNSVKGFEEGAKAAVSGINVLTAMTGSNDDIAKAKETAISLIEKGADVVMTNANQAGSGGIDASKQKAVLAIGSNQDQNPSAPDTVVTSVIQDYPKAMTVVVKRIMDGEMKPEAQTLGVKEGAVYLSPYHGFDGKIPQETKDRIEQTVQGLADGTIEVSNE
ncbi:basic membrane protein A [Paenibacillus phyllosphaerae]|uniref:Basic membrane protein A n=1 Tax=Paenibacillus phyllosphaerae TaxID=274593 RepID=A0A7W5AWU1_9BACL|nr:BMP family protein [Paenibacillus phyllosphaerae]MBB3110268.1 basic membrane protein A [Paenibacillus phyllosphaerae]